MAKHHKQLLANAFSKAAHSYDDVAELQRNTGHQLLAQLAPVVTAKSSQCGAAPIWLDLGSGTGYFTQLLSESSAQVYGVDIAFGMLKHAKAHRNPNIHWLNGDAEALPLASNSVDLVFSTLALQWCDDLSRAIKEIHRVLKPGGRLGFTTLVSGSLNELKQAWRAVDTKQHVNGFLPLSAIEASTQAAPFSQVDLQVRPEVLRYDTPLKLLKDLKGIGANYVQAQRASSGLGGKQKLLKMSQGYEVFRTQDGLYPATYYVCYAELIK
ncbi:malonyl-ACP O-methyltransferase BioC [Motilimonas cestriensis]|uniref:malonyl-ACP O-methyltransferase BioC n=1 Tax=Motilimonas cestriensis TaxID=2742685 RepID=UPI003DA3EBD0